MHRAVESHVTSHGWLPMNFAVIAVRILKCSNSGMTAGERIPIGDGNSMLREAKAHFRLWNDKYCKRQRVGGTCMKL